MWYELWLGLAETMLSPAGWASLTWTLLDLLGPLSLTVIVYVMMSPTLGVAVLTVLVTARSACCGVSMMLALLLPVSGSYWSARLTSAVLVCAAELTTRARICKVWGVAVETVPTFQRPVALLYDPWLGLADTKLRPAGSRSVI